MNPLILNDILDLSQYERVRELFRREIICLKKNRRVPIGDRISLVFENQKTIIFQIQEMMRAERITDLNKIQAELDIYNTLLPSGSDLSATLFIEIEDASEIKAQLDRFQGLDKEDCLSIELPDGRRIAAEFEPGHSKEDRISAVHYIRFRFSPQDIKTFRTNLGEVRIAIRHPQYIESTVLDAETRRSLSHDLD
jgi:hypothetical protein